ncbi:MAG TPA: helix-turn-helix domain-containing protein [Candidatus Cloacimonas sp.]|nr:helix-turn-helix domain-containing protein [Candidatus Cloacimonas sp.]
MNPILEEIEKMRDMTIHTLDALRANILSNFGRIVELVMRGESEIPPKGYCGAQEAARYMNMPLGTLRQMVSKGKIKFYKPTGGKVYFRYSDLDAFMEGKKEEQQSNEMRGLT